MDFPYPSRGSCDSRPQASVLGVIFGLIARITNRIDLNTVLADILEDPTGWSASGVTAGVHWFRF